MDRLTFELSNCPREPPLCYRITLEVGLRNTSYYLEIFRAVWHRQKASDK